MPLSDDTPPPLPLMSHYAIDAIADIAYADAIAPLFADTLRSTDAADAALMPLLITRCRYALLGSAFICHVAAA